MRILKAIDSIEFLQPMEQARRGELAGELDKRFINGLLRSARKDDGFELD
jgi:hypothetical protein